MISAIKNIYHYFISIASAVYFRYPGTHLTVIGVTGTDGKTTTTTLMYEILKAAGHKVSMISSVHAVIAGREYDTGFHVTTPNPYWVQKYLREAVNHGDTHFVLEVTSHGIAQHRIDNIPFAVGVITNITHEHLDWHKTFDRYVETKLQLLRRASVAVVNKDDAPIYERALSVLGDKHKLVTYGRKSSAMVTPGVYGLKTGLPGIFNMYNCLAALAAAIGVGIPTKTSLKVLAEFKGISGRMEVIIEKPFTVIVDFAHTPNAIENVLSTVKSMKYGRIIHVFGSAGLRDRTKRPLMGSASARYADTIVLTEEDYRTEDVNTIIGEIAEGIPKGISVEKIPDRSGAIRYALKTAEKGDVVIITGKGHEKSLCRGKTEYPWNDQEAVRKIFGERT